MKLSKTSYIAFTAIVAATIGAAAGGCGDDETKTTTTTSGPGAAGPGGSGNMGGGGSGNMGGGGSGAQGGGGAAPATCASYCADNIEICADADKQYDGAMAEAFCLGFCGFLDAGTPGMTMGDTLECRVYHTGAADSLMDTATHCPHGGPYGSTQCGASNCETYCAAIQKICTGGNEQFADEPECLADCNMLADADMPYHGDATATGNNFNCRGYHLTAASVDPATHCPHAAGADAPCQ
jgi:hypothetical protein